MSAEIKYHAVKCKQCGRRVLDGSVDFGGWSLHPTCDGIELHVTQAALQEAGQHPGKVVLRMVATEAEVRQFLDRAYGEPAP